MSTKETKSARVNTEIRVKQVRLIDAEGNQLGITDVRTALAKAKEAGLDLVEIAPNADPPVCRIMDYGKFVYQQKKKLVDSKKKQHKIEVKEIKFRPVTEEGDYQVKLRNLIRFLERGDKVKITVRFRGRELSHRDIGVTLLKRVGEDLGEYGAVEQFPKMEGKQMVMILSPKKKGSK